MLPYISYLLYYVIHLTMIVYQFHNDPTLCNDPANLNYNVDQVSSYMFDE